MKSFANLIYLKAQGPARNDVFLEFNQEPDCVIVANIGAPAPLENVSLLISLELYG